MSNLHADANRHEHTDENANTHEHADDYTNSDKHAYRDTDPHGHKYAVVLQRKWGWVLLHIIRYLFRWINARAALRMHGYASRLLRDTDADKDAHALSTTHAGPVLPMPDFRH